MDFGRPNHPGGSPQVPRGVTYMLCDPGIHDVSMDGTILYTRLGDCGPRLVARICRVHLGADKRRLCRWRTLGWLDPYTESGQLLDVSARRHE